jgi:hypothetical protein
MVGTRDTGRCGHVQRLLREHLASKLDQLPGFSLALLLARNDGGLVELTAHTIWESLDAIRAFAGDDITTAVVEPEARVVLRDSDPTVVHRDVLLHV